MRFSLSNRQSANLEDSSFKPSELTFRRAFLQIESIYKESDSFKGCIVTSVAKVQQILELTERLIEVLSKPASQSAVIFNMLLFPSEKRADAPVVYEIKEKLKEVGCSIRAQYQGLQEIKLLHESVEGTYLSDHYQGGEIIQLPLEESVGLLAERYRLFSKDYQVSSKFCDFELVLRGLSSECGKIRKEAKESKINNFTIHKIAEIGLAFRYCSKILLNALDENKLDSRPIANAISQSRHTPANEVRVADVKKLIDDRLMDFDERSLEESVTEIRLTYDKLEQKLVGPMVAILVSDDEDELQNYTRILGSLKFFVDQIVQSSEKLIKCSNEFSMNSLGSKSAIFDDESARLLRLSANEFERHNLCIDSIWIVAVKLIECFEVDLNKMRIRTNVNNPLWDLIEELNSAVPEIFEELNNALITSRAVAQFSYNQVVKSYLVATLKQIL